MKAATSEPRKYSPSPTPTTSGLLRRAAAPGAGSEEGGAVGAEEVPAAPDPPHQWAAAAGGDQGVGFGGGGGDQGEGALQAAGHRPHRLGEPALTRRGRLVGGGQQMGGDLAVGLGG